MEELPLYSQSSVLENLENLEALLLYLKTVDVSVIDKNVKLKLANAYEKLSFLMCHWDIHDKPGYSESRLDESLWGDNYLLKYIFEDHVTRVVNKQTGVDTLHCVVCETNFDVNQKSLIHHVVNPMHILTYNKFHFALTDSLWKNNVERYAFEKFIEYRFDNTLHCKICATVFPMKRVNLLTHINSQKHLERFNSIVSFKYINSNFGKISLDDSYKNADAIEDLVHARPTDNLVKAYKQNLIDLNPSDQIKPQLNSPTESIASSINNGHNHNGNSGGDYGKFKEKKNDKNIISTECKAALKNFMSVVVKNEQKIKYFCQPCITYEVCSFDAIDNHQKTVIHTSMVKLKQNIGKMEFEWKYCSICNANYFCNEELLNIHTQFHSQTKHTPNILKTDGANSINVSKEKIKNEDKTTDSLTNVNTRKNRGKVLSNYFSTQVNICKADKHKICDRYYFCFPCNVFTCRADGWDSHIKTSAHKKFVKASKGISEKNCKCRLTIICDRTFFFNHLKSLEHEQMLELVNKLKTPHSLKTADSEKDFCSKRNSL